MDRKTKLPNSALALLAAVLFLPIAACSSGKTSGPSKPSIAPTPVSVAWAPSPVQVDGVLDDAVWRAAPRHAFVLPANMAGRAAAYGDEIPAYAQLALDDRFLYVAAWFRDRDVQAQGHADQQMHFQLGDTLEVFLGPAKSSWYWEIYATPNARKTLYFFPSPAHQGLPSSQAQDPSPLRVAARIQGSLNQWRDEDEGWTVEVAIPLTLLAEQGVPLDADHPWRVLLARVNYSRPSPRAGPDLTTVPGVSWPGFHDQSLYGPLILPALKSNR